MNFASTLLVIIFSGMVIFELLLALGLPYGNFAWGGQHKVLPRGLRIGSLIASVFYVFLITVILSNAGVINIFSSDVISVLLWALVVLFGIGVLMNAISRSKLERNVFTPVVIVIFTLCLLLAIN